MQNIILLHTQFNTAFRDDIINNSLLITEEEIRDEDGDLMNQEVGFGETEGLALVYFKDSLKVDFELNYTKQLPENIILLVSDNIYVAHQERLLGQIKQFLKGLDYNLYAICHQRPVFNQFINDLNQEYESKLSRPIQTFSHYRNNSNPFYALVKLVNSNTKEQYNAALDTIKSVFPNDEEVTHENNKFIIQKLIKDLSSKQNYKASNEEIRVANTYLRKAKLDYNQLYLENITPLIKHLNGIFINL